jgi:2'-5' RNA ligase
VAGVAWVDTATTHITLHFFADLPAERLEAVVRSVGSAVRGLAPFSLRPGGLGSFGGGRPRVLWLGLVEEPAALAALAARVQAAVAGCGFDVDPRPFRPHVTLGRPRPRFDLHAWHQELAEPVELPTFIADQVVLYESRDGHHVRARLPFATAALVDEVIP